MNTWIFSLLGHLMFFFKDDVLFVRAHSLDNGGNFIYSLNRPEFSIDAVPAIASAAIDCSLGFEVCDWGIDLVSVGRCSKAMILGLL